VAGAVALTRFLKTLLFGVTATDTLTFVAVSLIFFVIAMCASLVPARRAMKVDPLTALRYE
jgi:putative ABC transport system permease protein